MGSKKSRKSPRAQVTLVARYRSPTAFEFVSEECFDLSVGGMFIKSPAPAPSGTLLKLECDVDAGTAKIRGVARVVWLREQPSDGHPAGMGVKFVKLDPGGREVINGILERVGGALEEGGEARRSEAPPTGTPEPFRRSPSSRPDTELIGAELSQSPARAGGPSDAVTVRPPPGPLPAGAVSREPTRSDRSPTSGPRQTPSPSAATSSARAAEAPVSGTSDTAPIHPERSGAGALRERFEQAKRQSSSHGSDPARAVAASAARPARAETDATLPNRGARQPPSGRPFLYAAIALLAAGGVYALSNRPAAPSSDVGAVAPELQPAADPQPAPEPPPPAEPVQVAAVAPAEPAPAEPQAAVPTSIAPAEPRYLIEVLTKPEGARVSAGDRKAVAPAEFDLGALATPISLKAELAGYQPASISVDRLGFMLDEGAMRRRIVLKLHEVPDPKAEEAREARKARRERAKEEAESAAPAAEPKPVEPTAEAKPEPTAAPTPAPAPTPVAPAPVAPAPVAELKPTPAPEPEKKVEPAPAPAPEKPKSSAKQKPLDAAMECLSTGDNECVVKALEGKAKSAQELELLIETYRTMGNAAKAEKNMQVYVSKHPGERRAAAYRRVLENRQTDTPAP